jgi:cytoskeletal protein RodZ
MAKPIKQPASKKKLFITIGYIVVVVALLATSVFFFVKYRQVNKKYTAIPEVKNQETLAKIAAIIDLPNNETPNLYEVKDKDKLTPTTASKDFFDKVANGDVVVVYSKANLAVIYRPSQDKVIKTDKADKLTSVNVAIIAPSDLQDATAQQIQSKFANVSIVKRQTSKTTVTQGYVADISGANAQTAKELADKLGLSVGQLPEGETKPEGAVLVVVIAGPATQ